MTAAEGGAAAAPGVPVVCCDLDGVIWRGESPIAGAAEGVGLLRRAGLRVVFLSNNSSLELAEVTAKLERSGVPAARDEILTSAVAAATLLTDTVAAGSRVLTCGGPGLFEALRDVGLEPVREPPCAAVVVGFHDHFDFAELDLAARAIRGGARFVSTNLDPTYPVPGDLLPGSGAITAAVAVASGRTPEVAGKPEAPTVRLVRARFGERGVMVGDRFTSDGLLAAALGWPFALVLSGITRAAPGPGEEAIPDPRPAFVAEDLGRLAPQLVAALG